VSQIPVDGQALLLRMTVQQYELHRADDSFAGKKRDDLVPE
jgi:hypothetical protein